MDESTSVNDQKTEGLAKNTLDQKMTVFIWDMDETLIILHSLLNGFYALFFKGLKNVEEGIELGRKWEKHILDLCDKDFFYEQIEKYNEPFLSALSEYDDGRDLSNYNFNLDEFGPPSDDANKRKLAYRYRVIADKYKQGLSGLFDQEMMKQWELLYNMTDKFTDGWFSSARTFLEECATGQDELPVASADGIIDSASRSERRINVLVTSGALVPSLAKCLLFQLDHILTHENVYSTWEVGKRKCFQLIKERFESPNTRFCVIGDGLEECDAAEFMQWPFIKIDSKPNGSHRFPGLTLRTVGFYLSVVYGNPDPEDDKE